MSLLGPNSIDDHQRSSECHCRALLSNGAKKEIIQLMAATIPKHSIYVLPLVHLWVIFGMPKCMQSSSCIDIWKILHNGWLSFRGENSGPTQKIKTTTVFKRNIRPGGEYFRQPRRSNRSWSFIEVRQLNIPGLWVVSYGRPCAAVHLWSGEDGLHPGKMKALAPCNESVWGGWDVGIWNYMNS